jgi:hypothetical protein
MTKLSALTYIVVAAVLIAVTWAGFWLQKIGPDSTEIGYWQEQNEKLDTIISPASQKRAQNRVREALQKKYEAELNWKRVVEARTPPESQINMIPHRWQVVVDARRWHGRVERDVNAWFRKTNVRLIDPLVVTVPYPTDRPNELIQYYFNYPAFPFPICIWDLGVITVEGSYERIMAHIRSWSRMPNYIASVRGLSLTGTGNSLRGTYGLTLLAYVNTKEVSGGPGANGGVPDLGQQDQANQNTSGTMERPGGGAGAGVPNAPGAGPQPVGG